MLRRDRTALGSVVAALCSIAAISIAATALDASLAIGLRDLPPNNPAGSSISLLELVVRLLQAILSVFGIRFRGSLTIGGSASVLSVLIPLVVTGIEYVPELLVLLAVIVALALAVRYSESVPRLRRSHAVGEQPAASVQEQPPTSSTRARSSNEVYRAWFNMIQTLPSTDLQTQTPQEWASVAIAAGFDPTAVDTLTETFEEVRYGDAPLTEERKHRARHAYHRLDDGTEGDRS